jgi:ferredoxin
MKTPPLDAMKIMEVGRGFRVDVVGFVPMSLLNKVLPAEERDEPAFRGMNSMAVLGRRVFTGVSWSRHLRNKQLVHGHSLLLLDRAAGSLARWFETQGYVALPLASQAFDFVRHHPRGVTPAGQGSRLLRHGAVAAGLGTFGLNTMVLTPQFGPRVHWAGLLTDWVCPEPAPLHEELCLGLHRCGRCAAVCPEDAIPRRAPLHAPLATTRGLDEAACARSSQPFGYDVFQAMAADVAGSDTSERLWEGLYNRTASEIYNEITAVKEGVTAGCSACLEVCPVGADYARLAASPHRQVDLPEVLEKLEAGDCQEVKHYGPPERPRITWAGWMKRRRSKQS